MAPPVAQELADRVGNRPGSLVEEMEKLALYLKADPEAPVSVTGKALEETVGDYNEYGVFRLADAVGDRDLNASLTILRALFEQGLRSAGSAEGKRSSSGVPVVVLDRLHAKLREIYRARALLDAGASPDRIGKALGKHRAFVPALVNQARGFPLARQDRILDALFRADRAVKSGGDGRTVLEGFLVEILGDVRERSRE
jgi:DNA polymerase III delta subunit